MYDLFMTLIRYAENFFEYEIRLFEFENHIKPTK